MPKFQRKIYNPITGHTVLVDADVAYCEHCNAKATSLYPVADSYGEYDTDVLSCNKHNPLIDTPKLDLTDFESVKNMVIEKEGLGL